VNSQKLILYKIIIRSLLFKINTQLIEKNFIFVKKEVSFWILFFFELQIKIITYMYMHMHVYNKLFLNSPILCEMKTRIYIGRTKLYVKPIEAWHAPYMYLLLCFQEIVIRKFAYTPNSTCRTNNNKTHFWLVNYNFFQFVSSKVSQTSFLKLFKILQLLNNN